jgi:hypothetical protein
MSDNTYFIFRYETQCKCGVAFLKVMPLCRFSRLQGGSDIPQGVVEIKTDEANRRAHVSWHSAAPLSDAAVASLASGKLSDDLSDVVQKQGAIFASVALGI